MYVIPAFSITLDEALFPAFPNDFFYAHIERNFPAQHKKIIGQAVQVFKGKGVDAFLFVERDGDTLGAPADGPGNVAGGDDGRAAGQNKVF